MSSLINGNNVKRFNPNPYVPESVNEEDEKAHNKKYGIVTEKDITEELNNIPTVAMSIGAKSTADGFLVGNQIGEMAGKQFLSGVNAISNWFNPPKPKESDETILLDWLKKNLPKLNITTYNYYSFEHLDFDTIKKKLNRPYTSGVLNAPNSEEEQILIAILNDTTLPITIKTSILDKNLKADKDYTGKVISLHNQAGGGYSKSKRKSRKGRKSKKTKKRKTNKTKRRKSRK